MNKPELLAPAGNLAKLKIAIEYGADAVFLGGQEFGLRSNSDNFTIDEIKEGCEFARLHNAKVYVTTNIYAHQENFTGFKEFVIELEKAGVSGIIVSDPGYIKICQKYAPNVEIHISTQQSITNWQSGKIFEKMGAHRIVLARELNYEEITEVVEKVNAEVEIFIHGATCSSYSGRCTLSNHMTMRDSNRGGCCQSCRWDYDLVAFDEVNAKYEQLIDPENAEFSMSAKDLSLLHHIPELMKTGAHSFKIEGRMKSFHYVATVVKVYRAAIDAYIESPTTYEVKEEWIRELRHAESRTSDAGAFIGNLDQSNQIFGNQYPPKPADYCGVCLDYDPKTGLALIEQRNFFKVGDKIEFFSKEFNNFSQILGTIYNENNEEITKANHPLMKVYIKVEQPIAKNWLLRKEN
ncbi:MAG: peptidase U32 family protein [Mycoplasmatales bacterium]